MDVFFGSECGLIGIAVDPEFETNGFVYVYAIEEVLGVPEGSGKPRVIRYRDDGGVAADRTVMVDDLP